MGWSFSVVLWGGVLVLCYGVEFKCCVMGWSLSVVLWGGV